jgi:hypothetical protein
MTARAPSLRMFFVVALLAVVAVACAKTAPCRPGTALLRVNFGAFAGQVTRLDVQTRLTAAAPWTPKALVGLEGKSSASLEIGFQKSYPEGITLLVSVAASGASGALGQVHETTIELAPGCTIKDVALGNADASTESGVAGAGGGAGTGGAAGTTGAGGSGSDDVSACPGKARSAWAEWKMPNLPASSGLPNPPDYGVSTAAGQTVVCDRVTGLMWQQREDGKYATAIKREDAVEQCLALDWGGRTGWRLPSRIELFSLVDLSQPPGKATIDPTTFPGTPLSEFWTYTVDSRVSDAQWTIDFGSGVNLQTILNETPIAVRCVR